MRAIVFACLLTASVASLAHADYHVLVADHSQPDDEGLSTSISSHLSRHRRSLTNPEDILASLTVDEGSGSDNEDLSYSDIQEFQFYMKNNDTVNSARTTISELMPGNAVLVDFSIHNQGQTYSMTKHSKKSIEEATVEYHESVAKGLSAVILGDVKTALDRCSDCRTDELDPDQAVAATVNIAPGDTLSVSLSYMVPVNTKVAETAKETYRTDVTIDLDESARNFVGVLMSPNYPGDYPNSADLTWLIDGPVLDMVLSANMISFDTEACCDHLYIYDGPTDTYPLLFVGSGGISGPETFVTTRSSMLVKFQTDSLINDGGFALEFHPTTRQILTEDQTDEDKNNNGTVIMLDSDGILKTPDYPEFYPADSRIVWDIVVETGYTIDFRIIDFDVFYGETMQVIDLNTNEVYVTLNVDSDSILPFDFNVSSSEVSVVFNSLDKVVPKRGLYGKYFSRQAEEIYLEQQDMTWHTITSPRYPHDYGSNEHVVWVITAGDATFNIRIEVLSLNLEAGYDFLYIYQGPSIDRTQIMATLSGTGGDDIEYIVFHNTTTIVLDSDRSITDKGFELRYKNYRLYTNCSDTTELLNGEGGGIVLNSNYPDSDYLSGNCQWLIRVNDSKKVVVLLRYFIGNYAQISFYDGNSKLDPLLWSSNNDYIIDFADGVSAASTSNEMLVIISRSQSYSTTYFYSFQEVEGDNIPYCYDKSVHTVSPGQITSTSYPNYAPYEECSWLLEAPVGYQVKASFVYFYTYSSSYRMVEFYNGNSTNSELIASCSSYYCPTDTWWVRSSSRYLLVVSDVYASLRFKLEYEFLSDSDAYVNREIGSVMSPSYPSPYPENSYEVTYIEVVSGTIMFDFKSFATESCCDILSVYDGDSTSSPTMYVLSGNHQGLSGQSSGPYLTLEFSSDGSIAGSGFRMDYCSTSQDCGFLSGQNSAYTYHQLPYFDIAHHVGSPALSMYYPDNADFSWYVECPDMPTRGVLYEFRRADIDQSDSLILYEGFQIDQSQIQLDWSNGRLDYFSYTNIYVHNRRSLLWFHSDTAFSGLGFFAKYHCDDD